MKSLLTPALTLLLFTLLPLPAIAAQDFHSKYAGQEQREIKSLSAADIKELRRGGGWGLAKAAELNGVPGPAHILQMADEIKLSKKQREAIEKIHREMEIAAIALGEELIGLEKKLNRDFSRGTVSQASLEKSVREIAKVRADLRIVHLSTHLQTPKILRAEQIKRYNDLRGYATDPCLNIPAGHDAEMWKRHNNCK
ncbi:MAG: hypothetical protein ABFR97_10675 [Thermodesulfobacteriota bacterium]